MLNDTISVASNISGTTETTTTAYDTQLSYDNIVTQTDNTNARKIKANYLTSKAEIASKMKNAYMKIIAGSYSKLRVKNIVFNNPATIVFWEDGTKTVVKCAEGEQFNKYVGFCAAVTKKVFGNNNRVIKLVEAGYEQEKPLKKTSKKGKKTKCRNK